MLIALLPRAFPKFNAFGFVGAQFYPAFVLQEFFCIGSAVPVEIADGVGGVEVLGVRKFVRKDVKKFVREGVCEGFGEGYQVVAFVVGDCWDGDD